MTAPDGAAAAGLEKEQRAIDRAYACLGAMRARTRKALEQAAADAHLTDAPDAAAIQANLNFRLEALADTKGPLTFGRIAESPSYGQPGAIHYIGRRHVEDATGDAVVVDWRAPVAAAFYRATWADPFGLDQRSRFALEDRTLVGTFEEDFTDPESEGGSGGVPDPLLAELDRARSGAMRDIVATIQAEQDVIIRAPLNDLIVVQGGPGTGKTAVGLHRAAFLLYAHRAEFERRRLLVVGPNRLFLTYIAQVLPSLGETSVTQATVETLASRLGTVRAVEGRNVARLKGDPRLAVVVQRAVLGRIASGDAIADLEVMTAFGGAFVDASTVAGLVENVAERLLPINTCREVLREHIVAEAWRVRSARGENPERQFQFSNDLRSHKAFKAYLDRVWPQQSAPVVVRSLLSNRRFLADAAAGLLTDAELRLLHRKVAKKVTDEQWTRAELALVDEANHLITGDTMQFGHVVIDEAQDLSALELRMVARRSPNRSLTVLGDLAQSTGVAGQNSWETALAELGHGRVDARGRERESVAGRVAVLELGYRVPEVLIDHANRLLPVAAPGLIASKSVRPGGEPPKYVRIPSVDGPAIPNVRLVHAALQEARALARDFALVAILSPPSLLDALADFGAVGGSGEPTVRDVRKDAVLEGGITLVGAEAAKGLEFDAVVVVDPAAIIAENGDGGYRVLYVALTRATQRVSVIHAGDLPPELDGGDERSGDLHRDPGVVLGQR
jgi:DNA helicase IV